MAAIFDLLSFKISVPIFLLLLSFLLSLYFSSKLVIVLNLSEVFTQAPGTPPPLAAKLNGVDGDYAIIGFFQAGQGESLVMTSKNITQITNALTKVELSKWESLTKLPAELFKFDVFFYSSPTSPNNAKKASWFTVSIASATSTRVDPGTYYQMANNIGFNDVQSAVVGTQVKFYYINGLYQAFYDRNGNFIPQSTGEVRITPTKRTQFYIWIASLALIIAAWSLLKTLFLSAGDVRDYYNFFS